MHIFPTNRATNVGREPRVGACPREADGGLRSPEVAAGETERDEVARGLLREDAVGALVADDPTEERFGFERAPEAVRIRLRRERPDLDAHETWRETSRPRCTSSSMACASDDSAGSRLTRSSIA